MNGISRETYEEMEVGSKLNVLFDYVKQSHECACNTETKLDALEKKVDRRKNADTAKASFMGLMGGMLAAFGKDLLK